MSEYENAFQALNDKQREAVRKIDGPVLVVAGPGTGKTQLLGTRAAFIAKQGMVAPSNILCLTYTEAAATELRKRLGKIMGPQGSGVAVHTFHSFGSWILSEYANENNPRTRTAANDLERFQIIEELLTALPLRHPFAQRGDYDEFTQQGNITSGFEAFKKAGLGVDELLKIVTENESQYVALEPLLNEVFGSTLSAKRLPAIAELVNDLQKKANKKSFTAISLEEFSNAIEQSVEAGKTEALGKWRTKHTEIVGGKRILKSAKNSEKVRELIKLYGNYQASLSHHGRFDYDDMILDALHELEANEDARMDIAEHFQYIMVDEYQDTNGAQNRLLNAILQAHPTDAPNVLVVGDDEQAIMSFQGAELNGITNFIKQYQPYAVPLTENYRSGQAILDAARQIITQTDERLEILLPGKGFDKQLVAKEEPKETLIEHRQYESPSSEYAAIAEHVEKLLERGVPASEIAIIGTRNKELKTFAPFLAARGIAVDYAKRENILEHPLVGQLLTLASCVHLLNEKPDSDAAKSALKDVLSAPFANTSATILYDVALAARLAKKSWLDTLLESEDNAWHGLAEWLLAAAKSARSRNFTQMLDVLIGRESLEDTMLKTSPFAAYIHSLADAQRLELLAHLIALRETVLETRANAKGLGDMLDVVAAYRRSGIELIDNHPLLRAGHGNISLLTAHSSKGREFEHVVLLSAVDNVWGPSTRGGNNKIALPENLQIYPNSGSDADKIRLLYVAMTRAKSHVLITSYAADDSGKDVVPLSFLQLGENGWWTPQKASAPPAKEILETSWHTRDITPPENLANKLRPLFTEWRISPSAVNGFLNLMYNTPQQIIEDSVLRFPSTSNRNTELGSGVHDALQAFATNKALSTKEILHIFDEKVSASGLPQSDIESIKLAAHDFLPVFLQQFDIASIAESEKYISAVLPNFNIPIGGQIDAIRNDDGQLTVIDYKTGKAPENDWDTKGLSAGKQVSLHFYRRQLLFYKLLLEAAGEHVVATELVFVEPKSDGTFAVLRIDDFDQRELDETARLIAAVYEHITNVQLPDVSEYGASLKGITQFEQDLLEGRA